MSLNLYLIRHGQTAWTLSGQHTGQTDLPLTKEGEGQARNLATVLGGIEFSVILTSPLKRARRTCELTGLSNRCEIEPDLVEWNYGEYEGLTSDEIEMDQPRWNLFRDGAPGGESPREISERADRLISRLRAFTGNVALFSHGHFFSALAMRWIELPVVSGAHLELSTSSVSILGFATHHPDISVISGWNALVRDA